MGFSGKDDETTGLASSGNALDDQTLTRLVEVGADLTKPRLWEHFLYCDDDAGARMMEERAVSAGWSIARDTEGDPGIVASRTEAVTPQVVTAARAFFESLAASVPGGDYDGWGAEAD